MVVALESGGGGVVERRVSVIKLVGECGWWEWAR